MVFFLVRLMWAMRNQFLPTVIQDTGYFNSIYRNILEDVPSNQASRWSSSTNNPPQFLTLLLTRPAIVHKIKFGKYEKPHICNIKKFKVFGGLKEDNLQVLLEA